MGRGIPSAFARRRSKKPRHVHAGPTPAAVVPAPEPEPEAVVPAPEPEAVVPTPEPEAVDPAPEADPVFSMSNTKKQLLAEAQRLGLDAGSSMTKAQLLDAILNA